MQRCMRYVCTARIRRLSKTSNNNFALPGGYSQLWKSIIITSNRSAWDSSAVLCWLRLPGFKPQGFFRVSMMFSGSLSQRF